MSHFLQALNSGRVLLMDGAMGTELQRAGIPEGECYEVWNLTHPERVRAIHQAYVDAGAEVSLTNTFQVVKASIGLNARIPWKLGSYEESRGLLALQWSAYVLCRSACGPDRFVLADLGSFTAKSTNQEFSDLSLLRRAAALTGLVDGLLLETCSTPRVGHAVRAAHEHSKGLPILLSLTYLHDGAGKITTMSGHSPEWFARRARGYGAASLGVNCGRDIDMADVIEIIRRYRSETDLPLFARPNAGTPKRKGKQWIYPHQPQVMAERLPELLETGLSMVGGCCGTTPEHIAAFRTVIDKWNAGGRGT